MEFNPALKKRNIFMLSEILDKMEFKMEKGLDAEDLGLKMVSSILRGLWKAESTVDKLICDVYGLIDVGNLTASEYTEAVAAIIRHPDFKKAWEKLTIVKL
jgi:hypothetical protein